MPPRSDPTDTVSAQLLRRESQALQRQAKLLRQQLRTAIEEVRVARRERLGRESPEPCEGQPHDGRETGKASEGAGDEQRLRLQGRHSSGADEASKVLHERRRREE